VVKIVVAGTVTLVALGLEAFIVASCNDPVVLTTTALAIAKLFRGWSLGSVVNGCVAFQLKRTEPTAEPLDSLESWTSILNLFVDGVKAQRVDVFESLEEAEQHTAKEFNVRVLPYLLSLCNETESFQFKQAINPLGNTKNVSMVPVLTLAKFTAVKFDHRDWGYDEGQWLTVMTELRSRVHQVQFCALKLAKLSSHPFLSQQVSRLEEILWEIYSFLELGMHAHFAHALEVAGALLLDISAVFRDCKRALFCDDLDMLSLWPNPSRSTNVAHPHEVVGEFFGTKELESQPYVVLDRLPMNNNDLYGSSLGLGLIRKIAYKATKTERKYLIVHSHRAAGEGSWNCDSLLIDGRSQRELRSVTSLDHRDTVLKMYFERLVSSAQQ